MSAARRLLDLVATSSASMAGNTDVVETGKVFGLRVVHNYGIPMEGAFCTIEELNSVHQILYDAVEDKMVHEGRSLRGLRSSDTYNENDDDATSGSGYQHKDCEMLCLGFPPGQCYIVYPDCTTVRRRDLAMDVDNFTPEDAERFLEERRLTDDEDVAICTEEMDVVIDRLQGGLDEVSGHCNNLLQEHIEFSCFPLN